MKKRAYFLGLLVLGSFMAGAGAESRVFTNLDGKTIEAEVSLVREGKVHLLRDGKTYPVEIVTLSPEDQEFLRGWVKENVDYRLTFQAVKVERREKRRKEESKSDNRKDKREWEAWRYDLRVTNLSGLSLQDLRLDYRIVVRQTPDRSTTEGERRSETARLVAGTAKIASLAPSATASASTEQVELERHDWEVQSMRTISASILPSNRDQDNKGREEPKLVAFTEKYSDRETLDGVWVRVYLGERQIGEWKSEGKLIKSVTWEEG